MVILRDVDRVDPSDPAVSTAGWAELCLHRQNPPLSHIGKRNAVKTIPHLSIHPGLQRLVAADSFSDEIVRAHQTKTVIRGRG